MTTPSGAPAPRPGDDHAPVRPYAVTGGRTRTAGEPLPLEALVTTGRPPAGGLEPEKRRIAELTTGTYLSIAEVSAHVRLPVGVVRVLVDDLVAEGVVTVAAPPAGAPGSPDQRPGTTLSVLESVLNGIAAL